MEYLRQALQVQKKKTVQILTSSAVLQGWLQKKETVQILTRQRNNSANTDEKKK
jgi:hypothetical protein